MPDKRARIIAVANQKGGVGKSTTAVSLGAALAELGHRVLVVDLDPQGNASTGLGIRHEARQVTVYDVLAAEAPIQGAIVRTPIENLWAVPSTIDLAGAEIELVSQFSRELRLRKALEPLRDDAFDFVFLDCPPSLGLLTVNALAAAEELIVPIQCEYYALEGLGQLLRNVRLVQQNVNAELRLTGIVMTMFDPRTKLSEQVVAEVRRFFGDRVYRTIIPRTVRLSEAPGFGRPITVYDPRSRGAESYRDLAREVVTKLPDAAPLPVIEERPVVAVAPPPPPAPARAPRPLVRPADLEAASAEPESEAEERLGGPVTGVRGSSASPSEPARQVEAQGGRAEGGPEGFEPPEVPADLEPEAEVEASRADEHEAASGPEIPRVEPAVEPEPAPGPPVDIPVPSRRSEAPEQVVGGVELARVITIEEQEAEPVGSPEPEGVPEPEAPPKRRWGLFRRGGDR